MLSIVRRFVNMKAELQAKIDVLDPKGLNERYLKLCDMRKNMKELDADIKVLKSTEAYMEPKYTGKEEDIQEKKGRRGTPVEDKYYLEHLKKDKDAFKKWYFKD